MPGRAKPTGVQHTSGWDAFYLYLISWIAALVLSFRAIFDQRNQGATYQLAGSELPTRRKCACGLPARRG